MRFDFATANRIVFGQGVVAEAPALAAELGRHALVVLGWVGSETDILLGGLAKRGLGQDVLVVSREPSLALVESGAARLRESGCDMVIGVGGGSALDAAKAIAALAVNPGEALTYLEVVGRGQPLQNPALPVLAIPTTAGTGSEVTRNAVVAVPEKRVKVSLRHASMLPRLALVDPELTYQLPPEITASTGLDALTQLIEPFVSNAANLMTDLFCREGIRRAARSLQRAYEDNDPQARQDMCIASLYGGMALASARLGAVHGFAGVLGGMLGAPHGAICARLLPSVMEVNQRALQRRQPTGSALTRYAEISHILVGSGAATLADGLAWLHELVQACHIQPLRAYGLTYGDFADVVEQASQASSMKGNPIPLTKEELLEILDRAL